MKRKLLSLAIAFALLSQTMVFAGALTTNVLTVFPSGATRPAIATTLSVQSPSEATAAQSFNYTVKIDMSTVRAQFAGLYAEAAADLPTYASAFDAANVAGDFVVTLSYPSGTYLSSIPTAAEINAQLGAASIFETTAISAIGATSATITLSVKSGITVAAINADVDGTLGDIILTLPNVTAPIEGLMTVSMTGTVDIKESDETSAFAHLSFTSNAPSLTIAAAASDSGSSYGGGGGGGGVYVPPSKKNDTTTTPTGGDDQGNGGQGGQGGHTEIILTIGHVEASVWGEVKVNDVAPVLRNDRTMIPIRFVAEALSAKVEWDGDARVVTITSAEGLVITIEVDKDYAMVGGQKLPLDSASFIQNDRTYLPVRFVSEALGATVTWDEATQQVTITK